LIFVKRILKEKAAGRREKPDNKKKKAETP